MLTKALTANAIFSVSSALIMLFASDWLAGEIPAPGWLWLAAGVGLLLFAAQLVAMARDTKLAEKRAMQVVGMDIGWVVLTSIAMAWYLGHLTATGILLIATVNAIVMALAILQYVGLKRGRLLTA